MKLSIKKSKPRKMSQLYQVKYIAMEMAKRTNKQLVGKARKEFLDDWYDRVKKDIKRLKVPAVYAEHIATAKLNNIEIPENKKEKTTIIVNFSKDASTKK